MVLDRVVLKSSRATPLNDEVMIESLVLKIPGCGAGTESLNSSFRIWVCQYLSEAAQVAASAKE